MLENRAVVPTWNATGTAIGGGHGPTPRLRPSFGLCGRLASEGSCGEVAHTDPAKNSHDANRPGTLTDGKVLEGCTELPGLQPITLPTDASLYISIHERTGESK